LNEALWLVHNNVPFDVAFAVDDVTRKWMAMRFSVFHGAKLNIDALQFEDQE
jgi:hypothetical protein